VSSHYILRTTCIRFLIFRSDDALPPLRFCAMQKPWKNVSTTSAIILASNFGFSASMFFYQQSRDFLLTARNNFLRFGRQARQLAHRIHGEAASLVVIAAKA
jgi:hypothetical protein